MRKPPLYAMSILVLSFAISAFAFVLSKFGQYINISGMVLLLSLTALLYIYEFYVNITCHYSNGKSIRTSIIYFGVMFFGTAAALCPRFWLSFLGMGNFLQGSMCFMIGHDKKLLSLTRKMFNAYGTRTMAMGLLLIVCPILLTKNETSTTIEIVKALLMAALLMYSYLVHMTREFFYAHLVMLFGTEV